MKKLIPICVLIFSSIAAGQSVQGKIAKFDQAKFYSVNYDPTLNVTKVHSPPDTVKPGPVYSGLTFIEAWMEISFPGREPNGNATFSLILESQTTNERFAKEHRLVLTIDGRELQFGDAAREVRPSYFKDSVVEKMKFGLSPQQMAALKQAKTITIHIGPVDGLFQDKTITSFRNILSLGN